MNCTQSFLNFHKHIIICRAAVTNNNVPTKHHWCAQIEMPAFQSVDVRFCIGT